MLRWLCNAGLLRQSIRGNYEAIQVHPTQIEVEGSRAHGAEVEAPARGESAETPIAKPLLNLDPS